MHVRDHAEDVVVSGRDGGRRLQVPRGRRRRHAHPHLRDAGQEGADAHRARFRRADPEVLRPYFAIKYPFGKLDIVAVPDFAAGAMENTAAIFYRETDLLADSEGGLGGHAQEHRVGAGARDGAPVVRRSRHDAVVGRHLAERRVRHLDGQNAAGRRGSRSGTFAVDEACESQTALEPRLAAVDARPSSRRSRRRPKSTRPSTRSPTKRARPSCG